MAYGERILDHFENPRNVGSLDKDDLDVGIGLAGAPACGDVAKLSIKVNPETGIIEEALFKGFGCGSLIASMSLTTELIKGKSIEEAEKISNGDIVEELNLPPVKIHCSVLSSDVVLAAIADYRKKRAANGQ
jgi:nitrogen fixation protein NifU and related proteins